MILALILLATFMVPQLYLAPRYSEFPQAGQGIWDEVDGTSDVMDWLFAQKRD